MKAKVGKNTRVWNVPPMARRMLHGAVLLAVAASLPAVAGGGAAWAAGGASANSRIQVNNVAAGSAAISQAGSVTNIRTASNNTIINYQRLSVGAGETLNFLQPSRASRVLNRIQGSEPTVIDGSVFSNGRVYFVNPAGVMFGNGAVINVGQIYAAAGHLSDADFLAGVNRFTDNTGMVRNDGTIQARAVHLVGANVANFGLIVANGGVAQGIVTMTAGKDVYLGETRSPTGQPSVLVKVSGDGGARAGTGVQNSGTVDAGKGSLRLGAGDVYAAGIYNTGTLRGKAITLNSGMNSNVSTGTIDAHDSAGRGGAVVLAGDRVGVFSGTVDASGATGGGTIKIGGDAHGGSLDGGTAPASQTVIGPSAVIKADAMVSGNGGSTIIWADGATRFYGAISARGGAGGDGGFAEVSGKQGLVFGGAVDLTAPAGGLTGTLLMDPNNIGIEHRTSGTSTDDGQVTDATINFADGGGGDFTISDLALNNLAASTNIMLQANGNITLNSSVAIDLAGNNSLAMQAKGNILLQSGATIMTHGTGAVTLQAAGNLKVDGVDAGNHASITAAGTGGVTLTAGDQSVGGGSAQGTLTLDSFAAITAGGNISLHASEVDFIGNNAITAGAGHSASATAINDIIASGPLTGAALNLTAGGNVSINALTLTGAFSSAGVDFNNTVPLMAAGVTINHTGAVSIDQAIDSTGFPVSITGNTISVSLLSTVTGSTVAFADTAGITINALITGTNGVTSTGPSTFMLQSSGGITTTNGAVTINHSGGLGGLVTINGPISAGNATVAVSGLGVTTGPTGSIGGGSVSLTGGTGNIALAAPVTATGPFSSSGAAFSNGLAVSAHGITINQTGTVILNDPLNSAGFPVSVTGSAVSVSAGAPVAGSSVTLVDSSGGGVSINDVVTTTAAFNSSGPGSFAMGSTGALSTSGGGVTINHGGPVTIDGPIAAGAGAVSITGLGITTAGPLGTIDGGAITLAGGTGAVSINQPLTGSGAVSVSGSTIAVGIVSPVSGLTVSFTDASGIMIQSQITGTNAVTSTGGGTFTLTTVGAITTTNSPVTITHASGLVNVNGPINAGTGKVAITGLGLNTGPAGTITGGTVTLAAGTGDIALAGIVAAGGPFSSSGAAFSNGLPISGHGITINQTGTVIVNAALSATAGGGAAISVTGSSVTVALGAPVSGATVAFNGPAGVTINDQVTGSGGVTSTGAAGFTLASTGGITTTGGAVALTHAGGPVAINGPINAGAGAVNISGLGITTASAGTINGGAVTLAGGSGDVTLGKAVTGSGALLVAGKNFSNSGGTITVAGGSLTMTGSISIAAAFSGGSGPVNLSGVGVTTTAALSGGAITLAGGSGNISVGATVTGTGQFTATGANFSNTGGPITVHGASLTMTGTSAFSAALDGDSGAVSISAIGVTTSAPVTGAAITLSGGSGNLTIGAPVTGTGAFGATGVAFDNSGGPITATSAAINMTGPVSLTAALNTGAGAASVSGSSLATSGSGTMHAGAISLASTSTISVDAAVTGTGLFTATSTGAFSNSANLTGNGITISATSQTVGAPLAGGAGAVTLSGTTFVNNAAVSGAGIKLTESGSATLNADLTTSGNLTIDAAGVTQPGGIISASSLVLKGTGTFSLLKANSAGTLAASVTGPITYINATSLSVGAAGSPSVTGISTAGGDLTLTVSSGTLSIISPINTAGGAVSLTAPTISSSAGGTINGAVVTLSASTAISLGSTLTAAGNFSSSGGGTFSLTSTGAITAAGPTVTINHAGLVTINGPISDPGAALQITGHGVTSGAAGILSATTTTITAGSGDVSLAGAVNGSSTFTVTGAAFSNTGAINGNGSFLLTMTGGVSINGPVTFGGTANVDITGAGATNVTQDITADANVIIHGPVNVSSGTPTITAGGNLTLGNLTGPGELTLMTNGAASLISVGAIGTSTASRFGNITFKSSNLVVLGGDIFAENVQFEDDLAGTRPDVPTAATIFRDTALDSNHTLTIDAAAGFAMEQNQKLTVYDSSGGGGAIGNLTIKTNHQTITIGDLSALGKIVLDTGSVTSLIRLINRSPQHELLSTGSLSVDSDKGMDVVAGFNGAGAIFLRGTVVAVGADANHRISFASVTASDDLASQPNTLVYQSGSNLAVVPLNTATADLVNESKMLSASTVLDLIGTGTSGTTPTATQGTVIPRDVQTLAPERSQAISGALRDALQELGIYARDLRPEEVIEYLIGRALYDDVPYKLDPGPTDTTVAANRLPFSPVLPMVDAYRHLFFKQEVDDKGNLVYENGKPKMVAQDSAIYQALGQSWQAYRNEKADDATPAGFRAYLELHEHDKDDTKFLAALDYLNQLRDLLKQIQSLGLTKNEFEVSQKVLFSKVRPPNIREEDFPEAVFGPSSRAGNAAASR